MPGLYRVSVYLGLAILGAGIAPACAEERILSFDSRIAVNPDLSLDVTETITINVEGVGIKRGIVKDLPASPRGGKDRRAGLGLKVLSVTRDGVAEPFKIEPGQTGTQLRTGKADVLLAAKPTTYVIHYRVVRPGSSPDRYNELAWDVTGNSWALPIDKAFVTVAMPAGAQITQAAAAVRLPEGIGHDIQIGSKEGSEFTARTTAPLAPGSHFTILVEWPKGSAAVIGVSEVQFPAQQWTTRRKRFSALRLR